MHEFAVILILFQHQRVGETLKSLQKSARTYSLNLFALDCKLSEDDFVLPTDFDLVVDTLSCNCVKNVFDDFKACFSALDEFLL